MRADSQGGELEQARQKSMNSVNHRSKVESLFVSHSISLTRYVLVKLNPIQFVLQGVPSAHRLGFGLT